MKSNPAVHTFLHKMRMLQKSVLSYLDCQTDRENEFQNVLSLVDDFHIREEKHELKAFLHLLLNLSINYKRSIDFYESIEKLVLLFKVEIPQFFSNNEIFVNFRKNKRLILALIQNGILIPTDSIATIMRSKKYAKMMYPQYFYPEFKQFYDMEYSRLVLKELNCKADYSETDQEKMNLFEQKRKFGENDLLYFQLMQNDSVDEYIRYVNETNFPTQEKNGTSIFETNQFLLNRKPTSIEYAAFYGSINIFNYLLLHNSQLTPSLWLYSIHGRNPEIIHILEENDIVPLDSYIPPLLEAIKCHHNEIANYILDKYCSEIISNIQDSWHQQSLKSFNYYYFPNELNKYIHYFFYLCKYDHCNFVQLLLDEGKIDINAKHISRFSG